LGLWVCPSQANYLLFLGPEDLSDALLRRGILVRDCRNYHGLGPGWYRAAVRRREENDRFLQTLKTILGFKGGRT
jgi:threonine-phosphate decarboxylase